MEPIYRLCGAHLGDHWAGLSLMRYCAATSGQRPRVVYTRDDQNFLARFQEIDALLSMDRDGDEDRTPIFTQEPYTCDVPNDTIWACPVVPTKRRWSFPPLTARTVVYQFDGVWSAAAKNPSVDEQTQVLNFLTAQGYVPVRLGRHLSLARCVQLCSIATLFVGCDSGMSHVAHSVGVPVYLLEYGLPVVGCHRQKQFVACRGARHFMQEVHQYLVLTDRLTGRSTGR